MHITRDTVEDVTVARLIGVLDGTYAQDVHEGIVPLLLDRQPILLDFSEVPHVSQDGLRTMLAIYRQAQALNGKVCVVGVGGDLHLALSATGFLRFFLVAEDVPGGLDVLRAAAGIPAAAVAVVVTDADTDADAVVVTAAAAVAGADS